MNFIERTYKFLLEQDLDHTHDLGHILRVTKFAEIIALSEKANKEIVTISALLHDIARPDELKGVIKDHAEEGAKRAKEFLISINYPYYEEVYYCINNHRFKKQIIPETLEAKILQDADRLDALGYIGIARVFMHKNGGSINERINHFYEKILKLKDFMHTKTARKIAVGKSKIIEDYINGLKEEIEVYYGKKR
ncbi:HD domain-containing protein [Marinitoga sp. 38H-ov]|uniref:HD domain-containing protein n=1 Tax=Marinitoga sp. 38H-ov TaxID=1755814 RepID=UPI0013EAC062|nr:HD domain-containing protein [Marinitoga sp. 38H-ov]KAF2956329.1 hypothetical protein AS160_06375 [Marinitoga sp. 38H-ov]